TVMGRVAGQARNVDGTDMDVRQDAIRVLLLVGVDGARRDERREDQAQDEGHHQPTPRNAPALAELIPVGVGRVEAGVIPAIRGPACTTAPLRVRAWAGWRP